MPNFIDLKDLSKDQLLDLISLSLKWKKEPCPSFMNNKHVVLIFEKPSLRTRVSFEIGINQLGGKSYILNEKEMQLGKRETIDINPKMEDELYIFRRKIEKRFKEREVPETFAFPRIGS